MKKLSFETYIILACSISTFLTGFSSNAISVALPQIASTFVFNNILQNWVPNAFFLTVAILSVPLAKICSDYGLKKSFVISLIVFLMGAILSVVSLSGEMFFISRIIQGIAAGGIYVTSVTIMVNQVSPKRRGRALGMNVAAVYIGLSLAPVLGGILTHNFGWESIFIFTIPFLLLNILIAHFKIPEDKKTINNEPFDKVGSILYMLGIGLIIFGFSSLNDSFGLITLVIGIILLSGFFIYDHYHEFPVFNVKLFQNHKFLSANLASLISYIATILVTMVLNYHLQYIRGMNSQSAGLILIVTPLLMAIVAPQSGKLSDKINPQKISALGMGLVTIALFIFSFLDEGMSIYLLIFAMVLQGIGYGLFSSPNTNTIMSSVPPKETPAASASLSTMRVIGQTLSIAMVTVIFAIVIGSGDIVPSVYPQLIQGSKYAFGIS